MGGLVGLSVAQATTDHGWVRAAFIGVESGTHSGDDAPFGIAPNPEHVIRPADIVLFVSPTSMPRVSRRDKDHAAYADYVKKARGWGLFAKESGKGGLPALQRSDTSIANFGKVMKKKTVNPSNHHKILVCGWRTDWSTDHERWVCLGGVGGRVISQQATCAATRPQGGVLALRLILTDLTSGFGDGWKR